MSSSFPFFRDYSFGFLPRLNGKGEDKMKLVLILAGVLCLLVLAFMVYCCLVMASIEDSWLENLQTDRQYQRNMDIKL